MRKITIIGAGQSGLLLGCALLKKGYDVTIVSNRTGEELKNGRVLSSQCMFNRALEIEREFGLDFWEDTCPPVEGIGVTIPDGEGGKAVEWAARLDAPAMSVDQRVKMPVWMDEFERLGGKLIIQEAGIEELENYTAESDLTLVASGKGEIGKLFERDAEKSAFDKPQRALALTYVKNLTPREPFSAVCFNLIPGVGEYFVFPALTTTGPCEIMVFEGIPGGPMDCWGDVKTPEEHLAMSKAILDKFLPWEAERCTDIELTDDNGVLAGRFPPTIRKPVGTLPSGNQVFGLGDAVCLNDPITGQGSNNATKCAKIYYEQIINREDQPFDAEWMNRTFDRFWGYAKFVVDWTNALLLPPPAHIQQLLGAAQQHPEIASRIANGFDNPVDFFPWFMQPQAAEDYLKKVA
ncbi:styrene monooxygenase/indole monooxygenase family protein [Luteithermobacter gelatinilyticus]|uniref:styrene monooxygenase/indole monooxygenase family protein n=1 Tax=Luteithermobacter gelatinilyticus TaxID=2582913 RepID=UPI001107197A|nr:styrene monooxygenase/indole monooxygenase family protein [Luteithermobacter gelatinilyticus]|tara:strand:- start:1255 stop:2475 length:1221 start_codon:yes stop_codon:yes gene_type:complete